VLPQSVIPALPKSAIPVLPQSVIPAQAGIQFLLLAASEPIGKPADQLRC